MSSYRQQRQAAAADVQRQSSPGSPVKRRALPVQSQVHEAPQDVPPLPAHTRLDYRPGQRDGYGDLGSMGVDPQDAFGVGVGMAAVADGAAAAMARGTSPYRDDSPQRREIERSNTNQTLPYQDQTFLSAPTNIRPYNLSTTSRTGLTAAAMAPGLAALGRRGSDTLSAPSRGPSPMRSEYGYSADRYSIYSQTLETPNRTVLGAIDPMEIADDDDDPFAPMHPSKSAAMSTSGGMLGGFGGRDGGGSYGQVGFNGRNGVDKSAWLSRQTTGKKRLKWLVAGGIALIILLAVAGGVVGSLFSKKSSSSSSISSDDDGTTLTKSSAAIQALLNNSQLHKVFPGIDYTPYNSQYPACLSNAPSQNNVTKDIAVLSQLTPTIRLYGTDCNQTELVLSALSLLDLKSTMKIYIGVWLSANATTNARQLAQMYHVLEAYGTDNIAGAIVGNEVLYRADMTEAELITNITAVKTNFTALGYTSLKVGTADLGSEWTETLADAVDIVGANVHPFFGGVEAKEAANWTYAYWEEHDVAVTEGLSGKTSVIAETGWPTSGGYYEGSTAGVSEVNAFLSDWVCAALTNGTEYWW